ncbi:hypothetical protein V6N13_066562 [Hibiscus sabdariffa]|uniref:Uncharacterized protein n=1 Tax=Hibiscus sabdariffa TaxID=183260 RepID=A0ABR2DQU1_9ROSI
MMKIKQSTSRHVKNPEPDPPNAAGSLQGAQSHPPVGAERSLPALRYVVPVLPTYRQPHCWPDRYSELAHTKITAAVPEFRKPKRCFA